MGSEMIYSIVMVVNRLSRSTGRVAHKPAYTAYASRFQPELALMPALLTSIYRAESGREWPLTAPVPAK